MTIPTKPSPEIMDILTTITNTLYAEGDAFDLGCAESEIDIMLQKAHEILPGKKRRVVAYWQWWDIQTGTAKLPEQYLPVMLYADHVLQDESGQFRPGNWVRSMFLLKLHANCIFETDNTFYIMVGRGSRKDVDIKTIKAIF